MLALLAAPAFAGLLVRAEISGSDSAPVEITRTLHADAPAQSTVFVDPVGLRWEVLVNADGAADRAYAVLHLRVTDDKGRVVGTFAPHLMGGFDKAMEVAATHPTVPGLYFDLSVVVSRVGAEDDTLARTFFAERGAHTYKFARLARGLEADATAQCDDPALVADTSRGSFELALTGKFSPGDRLDTRCTVSAPSGTRTLPVSVSFL
ncbi:MAG: hypothetical protein ACK4YP_10775 [Myxococcota bacterium]